MWLYRITIETQFTRLDKVVESLQRLQRNLARYRASVLKAACNGRLVPQDPNDEPAEQLLRRILAERRQRWEEAEWQKLIEKAKKKAVQARRKAAGSSARISNLKDEAWQDLPETEYAPYLPQNDKWKRKYQEPERPDTAGLPDLPSGWKWASLDECYDVSRGKFSVRPRNDPCYYGGKHSFVQIGDLPRNGGQITTASNTLNDSGLEVSKNFPKGTVLIAIVGTTIGNFGVLSFHSCALDGLVGFQCPEQVRLNYLAVYLGSKKLEIRAASYDSGGQPNINLAFSLPYPMPLPPLNEQVRIVEEVEQRLSIIAELEKTITVNLRRAARLR